MNKKLLLINLLIITLVFTSCGAKKDSAFTDELVIGDIVNGKVVTNKNVIGHSIVAIVSKRGNGQALCTGSIIAKNLILTAAHCVDHNPQNISLVFNLDVHKAKSENIREADKFLKHPNWNKHLSSGEGDIALIHFKGNLPQDYIPLKLANIKLELKNNQKVIMAGYGVTDGEAQTNSGKLRQTSTEIIDRKSETEIITDGQQSSVCFGDSGGPAFIKVGKEFVQWGVASSVTNQACNEASIHTEVMPYEEWIYSTENKFRE